MNATSCELILRNASSTSVLFSLSLSLSPFSPLFSPLLFRFRLSLTLPPGYDKLGVRQYIDMRDAFAEYDHPPSSLTLSISSEESVPITHKVLTCTFNYSNMQFYGYNIVDDLSFWAVGSREGKEEKEGGGRGGGEGGEGGGREGLSRLFIISDAASLTDYPVGERQREQRMKSFPSNVSLIVNCQEDSPDVTKYKG